MEKGGNEHVGRMEEMRKYKKIVISIMLLLMVWTVGGCSFGQSGEQALDKFDKDKQSTIKVMYWDEQYFMQQYGYMFMAKYPNIDIEVVSMQSMYRDDQYDPENSMKKFIEQENPDVLLLSPDELAKLASEQMLYDLEPVISQDKFDIENIHSTVIDYLKFKGDGKLYGLSPTFSSKALFINQKLFQEQGVTQPEGAMSWEELLQLAQRFPSGGDESTRIYGYMNPEYQSDPFSMTLMIGNESGLMAEDQGKVLIGGDAWKSLFEQVIEAYKSGSVAQVKRMEMGQSFTQDDWLRRNHFVAGKVAMTLGDPYLMQNLEDAKAAWKDDMFEWDIVNAPVGSDSGLNTNFYLNDLFAINAKSPNLREAWEFVKYANGDELARVRSKVSREVFTRTTYMTRKDGRSLEPFYQLTFNNNESVNDQQFGGFQYMIQEAANKEIEEVISGNKSLDDAIQAIEKLGQDQVNQMKLQKDKQAEGAVPGESEESNPVDEVVPGESEDSNPVEEGSGDSESNS